MEIQDSQPRPVVEKGSGVQRLVRRLLPLAIKVFQADWIEVRKKNDVEIVDDCEVVFSVCLEGHVKEVERKGVGLSDSR